MRLEALRRKDALGDIQGDFKYFAEERATRASFIAEQIRALVCMGSFDASLPYRSTGHITRTVRQRVSQIWDTPDDSLPITQSMRRQLDRLQRLGDIVQVGKKWAPAPMRVIRIAAGRWLLVGGLPLQLLPLALKRNVRAQGYARVLTNNVEAPYPEQSLLDWLGSPHENTEQWAELFIKHKAKEMRPNQLSEGMSVYQANRWIDIDSIQQPEKLCLVRQKVSIGFAAAKFNFGLARLVPHGDTGAQMLAYSEITNSEARRLQPILSGALQRPLKWISQNGYVEVVFRHPLSTPESKLLDLGWEVEGLGVKPWPKRFRFGEQVFPAVQASLNFLGYELNEQQANDERGEPSSDWGARHRFRPARGVKVVHRIAVPHPK